MFFRSTALGTSSAAGRFGSFSASYTIWLVSYSLHLPSGAVFGQIQYQETGCYN